MTNKNVKLSVYTTLKIGGPAKFFAIAETEKDLEDFTSFAKRKNLPFILIGSGSNLLVSDSGFEGLIVKNEISEIRSESGLIKVKSGTLLSNLVDYTINNGLSGMERLTGIPGTVGGAIFGNAGAYGETISDYLTKVLVYDGKKEFWLTKKDCKFDYRESIFKKTKWPILEAEFKLNQGDKTKLKEICKEISTIRNKKYRPSLFSCGSFFKNIPLEKINKDLLSGVPPRGIKYGKVLASVLLESVGAKGARAGNIKITDFHANLIINLGNGKANDFLNLTEDFALKVFEKYGVKLEPEVQLVGF